MKYILSFAVLLLVSCCIGLPADEIDLSIKKRATCAVTLNPNLTRDQIIDILARCMEANREALNRVRQLAAKYNCVGTVRQIILCIIRNRRNLDAGDWNVILEIFRLVTQCTQVIVIDRGNLSGVPYLQELVHCLADLFGI